MKRLGELTVDFKDILVEDIEESFSEREISAVIYDTRTEIIANSAFVCISGATFDGHDFAREASEKGAWVIFAEKDIDVPAGTAVIRVTDSRKALSLLAAAMSTLSSQYHTQGTALGHDIIKVIKKCYLMTM